MAHIPVEVKVTMDPRFTRLLEMQRQVQQLYIGDDPGELPPERKMAFLMETGLGLIHEVVEAQAETGWKPWATSNHINRDAYRGELADIFIFFMNLMLIDGMTMVNLDQLVQAKQKKNIARKLNGYDGVTTKCPGCKRAYDDDAVKCRPRDTTSLFDLVEPEVIGWCASASDYVISKTMVPAREKLIDTPTLPPNTAVMVPADPTCTKAGHDHTTSSCRGPIDVITQKCPGCGRNYGPNAQCHPAGPGGMLPPGVKAWCGVEVAHYNADGYPA